MHREANCDLSHAIMKPPFDNWIERMAETAPVSILPASHALTPEGAANIHKLYAKARETWDRPEILLWVTTTAAKANEATDLFYEDRRRRALLGQHFEDIWTDTRTNDPLVTWRGKQEFSLLPLFTEQTRAVNAVEIFAEYFEQYGLNTQEVGGVILDYVGTWDAGHYIINTPDHRVPDYSSSIALRHAYSAWHWTYVETFRRRMPGIQIVLNGLLPEDDEELSVPLLDRVEGHYWERCGQLYGLNFTDVAYQAAYREHIIRGHPYTILDSTNVDGEAYVKFMDLAQRAGLIWQKPRGEV